jgi:hypothetical protein
MKVPCLHETTGLPTDVRVSDYHPLTKRSVKLLLKRAKQKSGCQFRAGIQVRLTSRHPGGRKTIYWVIDSLFKPFNEVEINKT